MAQEKYDEAILNMEKAIKINPNNLDLWLNLAAIYIKNENSEKAKEIILNVLKVPLFCNKKLIISF